jgi:hypothetical protein
VEIIFREEKSDPAKLAAREAEYKAKFANPFVASARGFVDDVIQPHETRKRICRSLVMLRNKKGGEPVAQAREHPVVMLAPQSLRSCPQGAPPCGPAKPDPWVLLDQGFALLACLPTETSTCSQKF